MATRLDLGPLDTAAASDLLAAHVGRARLDGDPLGAAMACRWLCALSALAWPPPPNWPWS